MTPPPQNVCCYGRHVSTYYPRRSFFAGKNSPQRRGPTHSLSLGGSPPPFSPPFYRGGLSFSPTFCGGPPLGGAFFAPFWGVFFLRGASPKFSLRNFFGGPGLYPFLPHFFPETCQKFPKSPNSGHFALRRVYLLGPKPGF